jgi:DNA-binding MurR/RpiR family transcriptional regulator
MLLVPTDGCQDPYETLFHEMIEIALAADPARVDDRILAVYDDLTPRQKRLADVVLECGGDLVAYSATTLARKAGVSKATAARLFQRLGYNRFEDARYAAARVPWASPLRGLGQDAPQAEQDALGEHLNREVENLQRSNRSIDRAALQRGIQLLGAKRVVWVGGFRMSYAIARYLQSVLRNVRAGVRPISDSAWELAETFSEIGADDVVVLAAFRRRPPQVERILQVLAERSVPVILLSDMTAAPSSRSNVVHLRCHSRGATIFDSHTVAFSLINFLCSQVGTRCLERTNVHINDVERLHDAFGDIIPR